MISVAVVYVGRWRGGGDSADDVLVLLIYWIT